MSGSLLVYGGKDISGVVELGRLGTPSHDPARYPTKIERWYYAHLVPVRDGKKLQSLAEFPSLDTGNYVLLYREIITLITIFYGEKAEISLLNCIFNELPRSLVVYFGPLDGVRNAIRRALP